MGVTTAQRHHTNDAAPLQVISSKWLENITGKDAFLYESGNEQIHKQQWETLGSGDYHSVPTSWRKGKTLLEDKYLKDIESARDGVHFYFRCKCYHSFRKNDEPHSLKLALCIVTGNIISSACSCVAEKTGYCNHSLTLMLKLCKFSLFESKTTQHLSTDCDENAQVVCTSKLQTWHKRGRGETIVPHPAVDIIVKKVRLNDGEHEAGVKCLLYEAKNNVQVDQNEEKLFEDTIMGINPKMDLAHISSGQNILIDTKYGKSPVGSFSSYQLAHTESNFEVTMNISTEARNDSNTNNLLVYPRFPLTVFEECQVNDLDKVKGKVQFYCALLERFFSEQYNT